MAGNRNRPNGLDSTVKLSNQNGFPVNAVPISLKTLAAEGGLDVQFSSPAQGLMIQATGSVAIVDISDNTTIIPTCIQGQVINGLIKQVNTTGTTVASAETNIIVLR